MLYRIIKKKSKQNFLDNWTIRIRIFWRFRCSEQVRYYDMGEAGIKNDPKNSDVFYGRSPHGKIYTDLLSLQSRF